MSQLGLILMLIRSKFRNYLFPGHDLLDSVIWVVLTLFGSPLMQRHNGNLMFQRISLQTTWYWLEEFLASELTASGISYNIVHMVNGFIEEVSWVTVLWDMMPFKWFRRRVLPPFSGYVERGGNVLVFLLNVALQLADWAVSWPTKPQYGFPCLWKH
jgi:hypothetical protein